MHKIRMAQVAIDEIDKRYAQYHRDLDHAYYQAQDILKAQYLSEVAQYRTVVDSFWGKYGEEIRQVITPEIAVAGKKSINLEGAVIGFAKGADRFDITDEEAVENWALVHFEEAVKYERKIYKDKLKKWIKDNKAEIPGTKIIPGMDEFYCKIGDLKLQIAQTEAPHVQHGQLETNDSDEG